MSKINVEQNKVNKKLIEARKFNGSTTTKGIDKALEKMGIDEETTIKRKSVIASEQETQEKTEIAEIGFKKISSTQEQELIKKAKEINQNEKFSNNSYKLENHFLVLEISKAINREMLRVKEKKHKLPRKKFYTIDKRILIPQKYQKNSNKLIRYIMDKFMYDRIKYKENKQIVARFLSAIMDLTTKQDLETKEKIVA